MAKLIGISGPQGSGKTTLLNVLDRKIDGVDIDTFKVSRTVQRENNAASLEDLCSNLESVLKFQNRIIELKIERDEQAIARHDVDFVIVDRTFIDIIVYTRMWITQLIGTEPQESFTPNAYRALRDISTKCVSGQEKYSGVIYVPFMEHVPWDIDPNRANRNLIGEFTEHSAHFIDEIGGESKNNIYQVTGVSISDRVSEVIKFIKGI